MNKLIFLDIDGVLNSTNDHKAIFKLTGKPTYMGPPKLQPGAPFTRENLNWGKRQTEWLHGIVNRTDAQIVITSTWKNVYPLAYQYIDMFSAYGWRAPVIDVTEDAYSRKAEISLWFKEPNTNYVIIDDSNDFFPEQRSHHVQTDREIGLTADDARRAIEILNSKD